MNTEAAILIPSRAEAEKLLEWAGKLNPGPWVNHAKVVARAAQTIAQEMGLDADRAYVSGLLHDIGRFEGVRGLHHVYAGYALMKEKGYDVISEICLSHSFPHPVQVLGAYSGGEYDCTPAELEVITNYLATADYNDYDRLVQLCDSIGSADGVCLIEKRLNDVVSRYGFNSFTLKKWDAYRSLKSYFDIGIKGNIYDLFYDEVRDVTFK